MTLTLRTLPTCDAIQIQMPRKQANKDGNCHRFHWRQVSGGKTRKDTVYLLRPRYKTMQDWPCTREDKGPFTLSCHVMSAPLCKLYEHYCGPHNTQFLIHSGTPLRPKAARMEPHTHTKRHAGNFLWSWQAEWLAGACAVRPYVAVHDILTWGEFSPSFILPMAW